MLTNETKEALAALGTIDAEQRAFERRQSRRTIPKVRTLIDYKGRYDANGEWHIEDRDLAKLERLERLNTLACGKVPPMFAVAVRTTRNYGGPEEGGWWYDWNQIEEVRRAFTFRTLLQQVRALQAEYPTSKYGRHSCADTSGDVTIFLVRDESLIDGLQSTERPRYE